MYTSYNQVSSVSGTNTTFNPLVQGLDNPLTSSTENGEFALTAQGMAHRQKTSGCRGGSLVAFDQQLVGSRPTMKVLPIRNNTHNPKVTKANAAHASTRIGKNHGISRDRFTKMFQQVIAEGRDVEQLAEQFADLVVLAFHNRDIDHGKGERQTTYWYIMELFHIIPETVLYQLVPLLVEYGSYADIPRLAEIAKEDPSTTRLYSALVEFYGETLRKDAELPLEKRSLAGKWATRIDSHFDRSCGFGKAVAKYLFPVEIPKGASSTECGKMVATCYKTYRKLIVELTKEKCVEPAMCSQDWRWIADNLKKVTGKAQFKYRRSFRDEIIYGPQKGERRHPYDPDRTYLVEKLEEATTRAIEHPEETIIKGGKTLQAYEIVSKYLSGSPLDPTLEAQWTAILHELTAPREWCKQLASLIENLDSNMVFTINSNSVSAAKYLRNTVSKAIEKTDLDDYYILTKCLDCFKNQTSVQDFHQQLNNLTWKWDKQGKAFDGDVSIVDTSGSMSGTPMDVAISLGILVGQAQSDESPWKGRCLTFSSEPSWHSFNGDTLHSIVNGLKNEGRWGNTTNFARTINMILKVCVDEKVPSQFLPRRLWCFTDMEFNRADNDSDGYHGYQGYHGNRGNTNKNNDKWGTAYVKTNSAFINAGYSSGSPGITFWNIRASGGTTQCQSDDKGVTTYGGFSQNLFKSIIYSKEVDVQQETPWDRLKTTLDSVRYLRVREILGNSNEGVLAAYSLPVIIEDLKPDSNSDDEWDLLE